MRIRSSVFGMGSGGELLCGTTRDLAHIGLLGAVFDEPGFDEVDADVLVERLLLGAGLRRGERLRRIVKGVLGGATAGELAAQEGVSRQAIWLVCEEFRCELGQLDRATSLLDGYPLLQRAAQRCWDRREARLEPGRRAVEERGTQQVARRLESARRRGNQLADLRADAVRYVREGLVTPVGLIGEPVVWVRPGLPPRRATVVEGRRTRLVVELADGGRRVSVARARLRATADVDAGAPTLENFLSNNGMTATELVEFRRAVR